MVSYYHCVFFLQKIIVQYYYSSCVVGDAPDRLMSCSLFLYYLNFPFCIMKFSTVF